MTITVIPVSNTQTFGSWLATTNRLANLMSQNTMTADSSAGGSVTTGNSFVNGHFGINTLHVATELRGGNLTSNAVLTITTNTNFAQSSITVANATSNVVISPGTLTINGVNVNNAITGNAATAYTNAIAIAALLAANAYSNAIAIAANATNITSGTLATARLPATANVATEVNVGANVNINTSTFRVGNSTVNSSLSAGSLILNGANSLTVGTSLFVVANGNVGAGTSSPAGRLNVAGGRALFGPSSEIYALQIGFNQTRAGAGQAYYIGATDAISPDMVFSDSGGLERIRVAANGNLGIGNSAPAHRLRVDGTISLSGGIHANGSVGTNGQVLVSNGAGAYWANVAGGGGGGGAFNTNISAAVGFAANSTLSPAFTAPSTSGLRYIVHSIHITNIGAANTGVTAKINGSTYSNTSLATTVPVPFESAVELLKMPKVMQPNDVLSIQVDDNTPLHATITYETQATTSFFGAGIDITADATFTDLYTATGNAVIQSVLLANDDGVNDVKARVVWTDGSNNIQGYYCYDLIVPADATVEVLEQPKYLASGFKIRVYANAGNRLEAIVAGRLI